MRHNPGHGIMAQLVQRGAVPVDRLVIGLRRWDLHIVERRDVECPAAAYAEVDPGRADQRFDPGLHQTLGRGRRLDGEVFGQAVALGGVEDRESLEEGYSLGVFAGLARPALLVLGREAVGIDDGGAALALADIASERESLPECQPVLGRKAVLDDGAPEDQNIDAGISPAGGGVARHGECGLGVCGAPGLDPGHATGLQLGYDPVGDFIV